MSRNYLNIQKITLLSVFNGEIANKIGVLPLVALSGATASRTLASLMILCSGKCPSQLGFPLSRPTARESSKGGTKPRCT